jgi:hypothetical protein
MDAHTMIEPQAPARCRRRAALSSMPAHLRDERARHACLIKAACIEVE